MPHLRTAFGCLLVLLAPSSLHASSAATKPEAARVLIVVAHPDDEVVMAGTTYKLTQELGGRVDQVVITNGEGGFNYATLAERIYGVALTKESLGRKHLPEIRKRELLRAGRIMGVRRHFFLNQRDGAFTEDIALPLAREWNTRRVRGQLRQLLKKGNYTFVFTLLPTATTHGHHKAATALALEAAASLPLPVRPIVLGAAFENKGQPIAYEALPDHPATRLQDGAEVFSFDRTMTFGHRQALNYQVISNWVVAEHKSQGTLQRLPSLNYSLETFRLFHSDLPQAQERTARLFQSLKAAKP